MKNERQLKRLGRNDPSAGPADERRHIPFSLANVVWKTGGGDGDGGRGEGAEGPNRMGETWTYSRGTRPILHDGNSAPLSEDYDPSEIATDRIWKRNYDWPCV